MYGFSHMQATNCTHAYVYFSKDFVHYILLEEAYRNFMSCTFSTTCINILFV